MTFRSRHLTAWLACAVILFVTGCAKKTAPVPAEPPPVSTPTETPPVPPTTTETPPTTTPSPGVRDADLSPALFDYDSAMLREDARTALDGAARLLREHPEVRIVIEGHCDERGTVEYNQALGQQRAEVARDYLQQQGIAATRLTVLSYGKERPFDGGHDESAWQQNRRAHLRVAS
ncbi:MAG: peptidoglycan-associated lipoprotein Pal [Candidatus Eisenbacteria bacterium]|uniref:Peptidoglycan-associated lipoprotein n=1 Tax=Eiseniibacteriota bacterium TaxID=2212470 RepID=A0A849SIH2_UNCEI|nr:peptidoglycan-associated lipoprotein Pal [Candidatus Eisenbacteria bacterium]